MKYKHFKKITTDFLVILSPSSTKCKGTKKKKKFSHAVLVLSYFVLYYHQTTLKRIKISGQKF